ncbi:MAG: NADH-quinone oxidoreductase subunit NuoK [Candidatus Puniceispirillum sp.]|nr:NADH-quinone oxidoreductase subunit NuoK [Candidatus Pelagibacter sp.]MBA4282825.1 NADH-quinone oxidoreductase subunit NuoK [Candidatus Puniceispirillum sp.]
MEEITKEFSFLVSFSSMLFFTGFIGILRHRKSMIGILMSLEIMLLATNLNCIIFSNVLKDLNGQIFSIFILTTAAAEVAIGISLIILFYRQYDSTILDDGEDNIDEQECIHLSQNKAKQS